ncbi:Clavaminate synthase-like protein [Karstenula rhodostoma CBS 690.94]|uniref:Clavaminate synthase-like protein n=1 Tax=Karstenula rhodostoma CBS 690.94 TaxID=1392251 RepID=A0A9P4P5U2_9PLEO|nr:Clavaminate synthase-like protein [Karstenula rhodostoma CBS 690.94]
MSTGQVSTLDMSQFRRGSNSERLDFARNLFKCLSTQGFVKLVNHGVPDVAIDKAFELNGEFFKLPKTIKEKYSHPPCANPNRGWVAPGQEDSSAITNFEKGANGGISFLDAKESFDLGSPKDPLYDNVWPTEDDLPGFRPYMEIFYAMFQDVHLDILRALELVLDTPQTPVKLIDRCTPNVSEMRLNSYPPIDIRDLKSGRMNRISEHTDFGTVTLLFQDSVGGLEVEDQSNMGTYFPVECESKSTMLVNTGDSLQRLTNDVLTSVSHRVTLPISKQETEQGMLEERRSVVYFAKVSRDRSIAPMNPFVTAARPAKYPKMSAFEWNQLKLEKIYGVC